MTWTDYFRENDVRIAETKELAAAGASWRALKAATDGGSLIRARRGHYALPGVDPHILAAVRLGGRLACVSAAAHAGVFVLDNTFTHVLLVPTASRLRAPHDRHQLLNSHNRDGVELHWGELIEPESGSEYSIGLADALVQIVRCQEPRFALASLDNALHQRLIKPKAIPAIFAALPEGVQYLRPLIDSRSESGQETVLRFIVKNAGFDFEIQVTIDGVGRVDMLIEGCLVVEADSRKFHEGWDAQARDRARDCELAMRGYLSLRLLYRDIIHHPERVTAAIGGLLAASRHYRTVIH